MGQALEEVDEPCSRLRKEHWTEGEMAGDGVSDTERARGQGTVEGTGGVAVGGTHVSQGPCSDLH